MLAAGVSNGRHWEQVFSETVLLLLLLLLLVAGVKTLL
jgi:hypothetical protein